MVIKSIRLVFSVFILLLNVTLYGQWTKAIYNAPVTIPPSPTSASLGKYGNWPVSFYTGTPQISIPLYEISCGSVKVPVSLSYHASGITVEELASWTGLGWSLNAGGVITRSVAGAPDEMANGYANINSRYKGAGLPATFDVTNNTQDLVKFLGIADGSYDSEPDNISFNFNGRGGKLFLDENNTFTSPTYNQLKVTVNPLLNYVAGTNRYWEIVDEQGYTYTFGNLDGKEVSYVRDADDGLRLYYRLGTVTTAWYINQIISPDKRDTVFFKYGAKTEDYPKKPLQVFRIPQYDPQADGVSQALGYGYKTNNNDTYQSNGNCQLTSIEWRFGKIMLNASTNRLDLTGKLLDKISVYDNTQNLFKSFSFSYNYVNGRLFLNKVAFNGSNNIEGSNYQLEYNPGIPDRFSNAQDFWGYYNGANSNINLIPYESIYSQFGATIGTIGIPNANRTPNGDYMIAGSLNKIIFPTGGYSLFDYEPNDYSKVGDGFDNSVYTGNPLGGGLRIKSIKDYSATGLVSGQRSYEYKLSNGNSTGTLFSKPKFASVNYQPFYSGQRPAPRGGCYDWVMVATAYPYSLTSGNTQGSPIGYSLVTEFYKSGEIGKIEYEYSVFNDEWNDVNFDPIYQPFDRPPIIPSTCNDYKRGLLLQQNTYKKENTQYLSVSGKINTYNYNDAANSIHYKKLKVLKVKRIFDSTRNCGLVQNGFYESVRKYLFAYGFYNIKTVWPKLETVEDRVYNSDGVNYISEIKNHFYDNNNHINITRTESINSKLKTPKIEYKYPYEMVAQGLDPVGVYQKMLDKNIINEAVEQRTSEDGNLLQRIRQNYAANWYSDQNIIKPQTVEVENRNGGTEQRLRYQAYDYNGNVLSVSKENDIITSYIWGYKNSFPIAQVVNAKSTEIFSENFEESGTWPGISAIDNTKAHTGKYSARIDNPGPGELYFHSSKLLSIALITPTKFKYSGWFYSNGPSAELYLLMKRVGETGYYSYVDALITSVTGQWVYVEKEFTVPADVVQLNLRIDNNSAGTVWYDDIRLHPSTAMMTTYTYNPLIGMTSETDANNRTIYYSYDAFNRLQLIKDQEGKILKKICYNYAGQVEDCTLNLTPAWVATGNLRCATSGGVNTGYQEAEQRDNNPNSTSYNQLQWVSNGYNTSACPLPAASCSISAALGFNIQASNIFSSGGNVSFYIVFNSISTMQAGSSYFVATINGNCKPSGYRTIPFSQGGRDWTITIYPNGDMYWYLSSASASVFPGSTIGTSTLTYNL